jgi:hypothetical protein
MSIERNPIMKHLTNMYDPSDTERANKMSVVSAKLAQILNRRLKNASQDVFVTLSHTIVEMALEELEQEGFRISPTGKRNASCHNEP